MADTILDDQKAPLVTSSTDDQGNPVPLPPGAMTFDTSDHTIAVIDNTDPANPMFATTGKLGVVTLQATFTPADGSPALTGSDPVTVNASALAVIGVSLGAAVKR